MIEAWISLISYAEVFAGDITVRRDLYHSFLPCCFTSVSGLTEAVGFFHGERISLRHLPA